MFDFYRGWINDSDTWESILEEEIKSLRKTHYNRFQGQNVDRMYIEAGIIYHVVQEMDKDRSADVRAKLKAFFRAKTIEEVQHRSKLLMDAFADLRSSFDRNNTPRLYNGVCAMVSNQARNLDSNLGRVCSVEGTTCLDLIFAWQTRVRDYEDRLAARMDRGELEEDSKEVPPDYVTNGGLAAAVFGSGKLGKYRNAAQRAEVTDISDPRELISSPSDRRKADNVVAVFVVLGILEILDEDIRESAHRRVRFTEKGDEWYCAVQALANRMRYPYDQKAHQRLSNERTRQVLERFHGVLTRIMRWTPPCENEDQK
ncbi:hypothetical protein AB9K41_31280 [Cribrihabitans sp. XS_ASV171]